MFAAGCNITAESIYEAEEKVVSAASEFFYEC